MRTGYLRQSVAPTRLGSPASPPECDRGSQVRRAESRVSEGRSLRAVAPAYAELGDVADQLALAVEREDRASGLLPPAVRKRRKSA